ncbi:MAG: hypothetical protein EBQ95_07690 [Gammaproteobacteria bacterium]|nr:hypothetical protein [Gammaproteobacteria bacterium]
MSYNLTTSIYEQEYFTQNIILKYEEFQKKYFYELQQDAESWLDYWFFLNRYLNYYVSVVSYYLFGIFTCPAHQFEKELQLDLYKKIKVALKEKDIFNLKNILADLEEDTYQEIWNKAVADEKIELVIMMMNSRPLLSLDGLHKNDYALFERNLDLAMNQQFLLRHYHTFCERMENYSEEARAFFKRIRLKLMSPYDVLCDDLSGRPLQEFSELYASLSSQQKEALWHEVMVKRNQLCVDKLLYKQCFGVLKDEYLPFLMEYQSNSLHIQNYLMKQWQIIPLTIAHYQAFLCLIIHPTYQPKYEDFKILKRMSTMAHVEADYLKVIDAFEMRYLNAKKSEMRTFDVHQVVDAESEWVFAFKKMQILKKQNPNNKEWDQELLNLSKNQSLMNAVNGATKECAKNPQKFRPLGGVLGPKLKQWRNNSLFSKSTGSIETSSHAEKMDEKKQYSQSL